MNITALIRELSRLTGLSNAEALTQIQQAALSAARAELGPGFVLSLAPITLPDVVVAQARAMVSDDPLVALGVHPAPKPEDYESAIAHGERLSVMVDFAVVNEVDDPHRQLCLADVRRVAEELAANAGEVFAVELTPEYGLDKLQLAIVGCCPQLAGFERADGDRLEARVSAGVASLFVSALGWSGKAGTLLGLVTDDEPSIAGLEAEANGMHIRLERFCWLLPQSDSCRMRRFRVGVFATVEASAQAKSVFAASAARVPSEWTTLLDQRASPTLREGAGAYLQGVAAETKRDVIDIRSVLDRNTILPLLAACRPGPSGGLWAWCQHSLPELIVGQTLEVVATDVVATLRFDAVQWDADSLGGRGMGWVKVTLTQRGNRVSETLPPGQRSDDVAKFEGTLSLGQLRDADLSLSAPSDEQQSLIAEMVHAWRARISATMAHRLVQYPQLLGCSRVSMLDNNTDFVGGMMRRMRDGPPPAPPVPPFERAAIERARALVHMPTDEDSALVNKRYKSSTNKPLATLAVGDKWLVVLLGVLDGWPHATSEIALFCADQPDPVQVLITDVWSPQTRRCIDGDAFAFRRFLEWLRLAIVDTPLNRELEFCWIDEGDELDGSERMTIADWLLIDEAPVTDAEVVDWRCDHHGVAHGPGVESLSEIFGFTAAYLSQLVDDRRTWREFLREAIDSRFGETAP